MSAYKNFAVIGVGSLGTFVVDELLKKDAIVTILTRDANKPEFQPFKERGVKVIAVDYSNTEALQDALVGIEVVISTLANSQAPLQIKTIKAAKAAGVQLFIPSEYGIDADTSDEMSSGPKTAKHLMRTTLRQLDLPFTLFMTGFFADVMPWYVDYRYAEGYVCAVGTGKVPFSTTSRLDIARFMAHVLMTAPKESLEWAVMRIEGDRKSPVELAALASKKFGKKVEVRYIDPAVNAKAINTDFKAFLYAHVENGTAVVGTEEEVKETIAKFYPDWNPAPLEDCLVLM